MARISYELFRHEVKVWNTWERMLSRQTKSFAEYMNEKYNMNDDTLHHNTSRYTAIRTILTKHIQQS